MSEFDKVQDSGKRQEFTTGSVRDTREGKGRYDLLPPYAIFRLANHYANGAEKYGDNNWLKGQPVSRYVDSALRHIFKYLEGHRDEDHAIAAVWNMIAVVQTEEMVHRGTLPAELLDLAEVHGLYGVKPIPAITDTAPRDGIPVNPRHTPQQLERFIDEVRRA